MRSVRRNEEVVAARQRDGFALDLKAGFTAEQHDPFIMLLIVEGGPWLATARDALDTQVSTAQQFFEDLACRWRWLLSKQVAALNQASALTREFSRDLCRAALWA